MRAVRWNPAKQDDIFDYYAKLRRESPVFRASFPTRGTGWVVTRYDDVARVLKDPRFSTDMRNASNPPLFGFGGPCAPRLIKIVARSMVCVDDPAHGRLRGLVSKVFTPRSVQDMEPWVRETVDWMLDDLEGHDTVDLISGFALPLPLRIISEMLGIPEEMRMAFHQQIVRLLEVNDQPIRRAIRWMAAMPKMMRFFDDLLELRRRKPDDRLITRLMNVENDGDKLSRDELIAMIFLLLFAGHETSVNLIGNGLLTLLDHPDQLALLRRRRDLMPQAIEELLRFAGPVESGTMRFAREDVTIAGVTIPKGGMVMGLLSSADRDEKAFSHPDQFDIMRRDNRHLGMGFGLHYCLGASLGRLEGRVALDALLQRFPQLELAADRGALEWRLSSGLRGLKALPLRMGPPQVMAKEEVAAA